MRSKRPQGALFPTEEEIAVQPAQPAGGRRTPNPGGSIGGTFANLDDAKDYAAKASIAVQGERGVVGVYEVHGSYRVSLLTTANLVTQFRNGEELPAKTSKGA